VATKREYAAINAATGDTILLFNSDKSSPKNILVSGKQELLLQNQSIRNVFFKDSTI
jgi:hypothetical protein